jgi:hypothetical protein
VHSRKREDTSRRQGSSASADSAQRRWFRHPLYGNIPLIRHSTVGRDGRSYEWWEYDPTFSPRIPKGAVPGDVSKQVFCSACHEPKYFYVDETRTCVQCGSRFTFSAAEQKYWYETRKFNFSSIPIRCKNCRRLRRSEHALREQIARARHRSGVSSLPVCSVTRMDFPFAVASAAVTAHNPPNG